MFVKYRLRLSELPFHWHRREKNVSDALSSTCGRVEPLTEFSEREREKERGKMREIERGTSACVYVRRGTEGEETE